ncbi:hypothetical protein Dimus_023387 [Dionaea muscipula]
MIFHIPCLGQQTPAEEQRRLRRLLEWQRRTLAKAAAEARRRAEAGDERWHRAGEACRRVRRLSGLMKANQIRDRFSGSAEVDWIPTMPEANSGPEGIN